MSGRGVPAVMPWPVDFLPRERGASVASGNEPGQGQGRCHATRRDSDQDRCRDESSPIVDVELDGLAMIECEIEGEDLLDRNPLNFRRFRIRLATLFERLDH